MQMSTKTRKTIEAMGLKLAGYGEVAIGDVLQVKPSTVWSEGEEKPKLKVLQVGKTEAQLEDLATGEKKFWPFSEIQNYLVKVESKQATKDENWMVDEAHKAWTEGGLDNLPHSQFVKELEHMFAITPEEAEHLAEEVMMKEDELLSSPLPDSDHQDLRGGNG